MRLTLRMLSVLLPVLLLGGLFAAGCSTRTVEYSKAGDPHCPTCKTVLPSRDRVCGTCETSLRWTSQPVICWHCDGAGGCQVCSRLGKIAGPDAALGEECFSCKGSGACGHCDGTGTTEWGEPPQASPRVGAR